jgi:hypothetical protein
MKATHRSLCRRGAVGPYCKLNVEVSDANKQFLF